MRYDYYCSDNSCGHREEIFRSMKEDFLTECPVCSQSTFKVAINLPSLIVRGEPTTMGLLADRNTSAMSSMQRSDFYAKQAADKIAARKFMDSELEKKLPSGASLPKKHDAPPVDLSLADLTPQQQEKYIEEGKK